MSITNASPAAEDSSPPAPPTHRRVSNSIVRYSVPLAALLGAGPVVYTLTNGLTSTTGGGDTTFLLASSMTSGVIALLATLGVAAVFAIIGSQMIGVKAGLISAGYVLGWAAWGTGELTTALRDLPEISSGTMLVLSIEGLIIATGCLGLLLLSAKVDHHPDGPLREITGATLIREVSSFAGVVPVLAGAGAAVVATIFIAHSGMNGQTLLAALVAGIGASIASHAASNSETPSPAAPFLGVALAAVIAPLVMLVYPGTDALPRQIVSGGLLGYLRVPPADWAVSLLIGVPIGLGWTGVLLPHHEKSA